MILDWLEDRFPEPALYAAFGVPEGDERRFHRILVERQPLGPASPLRGWAARVDAHARS